MKPSANNAAPIVAQVVLILLVSMLPVLGSWSASFLPYDDIDHIAQNSKLNPEVSPGSYFVPEENEAYFPITMLSWRLDRALFSSWMPEYLGSWAPGTRSVNVLIHALACLVLWQLMLLIGLRAREGLWVALVFAVHPTVCESVCWAVERKNVLACFFGFLALWSWVRLRGVSKDQKDDSDSSGIRSSPWRVPVTAGWFLLALMSKQSALGLLPIFVALEFIDPIASIEKRVRLSFSFLPKRLLGLLPLVLIAAAFVVLGISGHRKWMAPPPGGSIFTALLTDTWIFVRYFGNILIPTQLSAAYGIEPVVSLGSLRLWGALGILASTIGLSFWLARSRSRVLLGWLWFFGALGPSMNLVSLPFVMSDRYVYLSLPGFFLILVEVASGLVGRSLSLSMGSKDDRMPQQIPLYLATIFFCGLAYVSVQRSFVWRNMLVLFSDAVQKEPKAAFARYGLGQAYGQAWGDMLSGSEPQKKEKADAFYLLRIENFNAMLDCVDFNRQLKRGDVLLELGDYQLKTGNVDAARQLYQMASVTIKGVAELPEVKAQAFSNLGDLERRAGRWKAAIEWLTRAVETSEIKSSFLFQRAALHLRYSKELAEENKKELSGQHARVGQQDLIRIPRKSQWYGRAQGILKRVSVQE